MKARSCVVVMLAAAVLISGPDMKARKVYCGDYNCTTYHVSDNTPRGTRTTSSGARATEYHTIAVDKYNPAFPKGTRLYVDGFGWGVVEDCGNLAAHGGDLDLFVPEGVGFRKWCKVYREETAQERKARLEKKKRKREQKQAQERKLKQAQKFTLVWDPMLAPWQIVTDGDIIPKGTVRIGYTWCDVVDTEQDLGARIRVGDKSAVMGRKVMLDEVIENAVG